CRPAQRPDRNVGLVPLRSERPAIGPAPGKDGRGCCVPRHKWVLHVWRFDTPPRPSKTRLLVPAEWPDCCALPPCPGLPESPAGIGRGRPEYRRVTPARDRGRTAP